jgi:SAM-dependent methyltransferase
MIRGGFMARTPKNQTNRSSDRGKKLPPVEPVRQGYDTHGPSQYYALHSADYRNPHEPAIRKLIKAWLDSSSLPKSIHLIDLACGSGEVTLVLEESGYTNITGIDPYTAKAYEIRTGRAAEVFSFEEIASGAMHGASADLIICSFAMHLCEPSRLASLCLQLSFISELMMIITPHKRPVIDPKWGWMMLQEEQADRVRLRVYRRIGSTH